jgi:hypothetical protein
MDCNIHLHFDRSKNVEDLVTRFLFSMLVLLAVSTVATAKGGKPDCERVLLAQVRLYVSPGGEVFMPASISGKEVYFLLSIGSGLPMVRESAVRSLGLTPKVRHGGATMWANGKPITHYVTLEETVIGEFKLLERAAPIIPEPATQSPVIVDGRPVLGYMGSTLFRNVDAELYLAERQLKLFRPFRCREVSPVYWDATAAALPLRIDQAGALVFTLELDGRRIEAGLLAGDRVSTIDVNATRKYFGFDETSPGVEVMHAESGQPRSLFHAMSLTGQGLGIKNARVLLRSNSTCELTGLKPGYGAIGYTNCINTMPFKLGTDLLSQMRIYISRERQAVYVTTVAQPSSENAGTISIAPAP